MTIAGGGGLCNGPAGFLVISDMKRPLSLLLLLGLLGPACSKHHDNPGSASGPGTVYVTGSDGVNPVLWINGQPQKLATNGGFGAQVVLNGTDVYVAGASGENNALQLTPAGIMGQFAYWKNGVETKLGTPGILESSIAITVNGNNVYYAGGRVYENGSPVTLQGMGSADFVSSAQTVGGDVYFAGNDSIGDGAYWKNGVLHVIAQTQSLGSGIQIFCMYVSNGDVYVGGTDLQRNAAIWKNGVETTVQSSSGDPLFDVRAIFVDGSDVYSISNLLVGTTNAPAYWKNGVQVNLPLNGATYGNATSIFVSGSDVYVTGATSHGAILWKNGVETVLAASGQASSVVVQ